MANMAIKIAEWKKKSLMDLQKPQYVLCIAKTIKNDLTLHKKPKHQWVHILEKHSNKKFEFFWQIYLFVYF